ncbi:hypothetical protein Tco_1537320, partial [Tanacetum coccineum]
IITIQSEKILSPKDTKTPVESPIPISPSSSVGSSSPVKASTPPSPDYSFNILSNSVKIIMDHTTKETSSI